MTTTELAQFYTPLIGLVGLAFWVGGLSNRVKTLEREAKELKDAKRVEDASETADHDRIVRMETILERMETKFNEMERHVSGIQRSLGNRAAKTLEFRPGERPD